METEDPTFLTRSLGVSNSLTTKPELSLLLYRAIQHNDTSKALGIFSSNEEDAFHQYFVPSDASKWSMMHWASYHGNEKVMEDLLNCNAASSYKLNQMKKTLDETNRLQGNQMHRIVDHKDADNQACNISTIWSAEPVLINTPLHLAARHGHLQVAWLLLISSYSVHDADNSGNTPLHVSSAAGHVRLVQCFLNDGADVHARNRFNNTAYDVAKTKECRRVLKAAMEQQHHPLVASEKQAMHQRHMQSYTRCQNAIFAAIDNADHVDQQSLPKLRYDVQLAIDAGIATETVMLGQELIRWLELKRELTQSICFVKENVPIISQEKYAHVRQLREVLCKCQSFSAMQKPEGVLTRSLHRNLSANGLLPARRSVGGLIGIDSFIQEGFQLCKTSHEDYLLNAQSLRVLNRPVTINTSEVISYKRDAAVLQNRIELAVSSNASLQTIEKAKILHDQRIGEIDLVSNCLYKDAWPSVFQNSQLPENSNSGPTRGVAAIGSCNEDIGRIECKDELPGGPLVTELYVWISSISLVKLQCSLQKARASFRFAEIHDANRELLNITEQIIREKTELESLLMSKDEEDKARAILEAQKASKKIKKPKAPKI